MKVTGDKLNIEVDLSKPGVPSSTGKTMLVANTQGAVAIEYSKRPGIKFSLNVMAPRR